MTKIKIIVEAEVDQELLDRIEVEGGPEDAVVDALASGQHISVNWMEVQVDE